MDPIVLLMEEHRIILAVLARLEGWARRAGSPEDQPELAAICEFLSGFVDPIHHAKEEDLLFPAMIEHGFPRNHGPLAVMLQEHVQGRLLTGALLQLSRKTPWTPQDIAAARAAALDFAVLLSQHIFKEDRVLYPMARGRLPPEEMARLGARMEELDSSPERAAAREHHLASVACWLPEGSSE